MKPEVWKEKNKKIYFLTYTNEEETLPHMQDVLDLLYLLNYTTDWDSILPNETIKKYILEDYFYIVCKNLILNKNFKLPEALKVSNEILSESIMLSVKMINKDS